MQFNTSRNPSYIYHIFNIFQFLYLTWRNYLHVSLYSWNRICNVNMDQLNKFILQKMSPYKNHCFFVINKAILKLDTCHFWFPFGSFHIICYPPNQGGDVASSNPIHEPMKAIELHHRCYLIIGYLFKFCLIGYISTMFMIWYYFIVLRIETKSIVPFIQ